MTIVPTFRRGLAVSLVFAALSMQSASAADEAASIDEQLAVCAGCHGADGVPVDAETPILAGQQFYYLYVQLKDYKGGQRANAVMSGIAATLEKDQMKALAEHYAAMPWPDVRSEIDGELADAGPNALGAGQCSQCHSTYKGDSRIPRLAGQQVAYLQQTMEDFKQKVRLNSAAKGSLMESFDDKDLQAMAHYLADL